VNCSGGKIFVSGEEIEGCRANILRRNLMRDVHDYGRGISRQDHPFHRPDKIIRVPKSVSSVMMGITTSFEFLVASFEFNA
jgi:hypothetical protein